MTSAITQHFATIKGMRQVHYRRAGQGPTVLLLHQSPASSAELIPLILELAPCYTVIAPDTPGNGLSTPLAIVKPSIDDLANGIVEFMDAIGLARAAVYGFHTGAACAMALAHRHADRILVAIANGYSQMAEQELADILEHYLPPLTVEWNGAHLLWAWSRIRDQFIFFPWYARRPEARLASGMPGTAQLHTAVMDLLRASDYAQAYRAAFEYDRPAVVTQLEAPTVIMTARNDALHRYLDLMPTPAASVTVHRPADYAQARQLLRETLDRYCTEVDSLPIATTQAPPNRLWSEYLQTRAGSMFALRSTSGSGRPLLFCHASTGSALGLRELMLPYVGKCPLLAVDLPGNGESARIDEITVNNQAQWLVAAIADAGYDEVDVVAIAGGAIVASALATQHPTLVKQLSCIGMPRYFDTDIELDDHGLHLLRAWNMVRDQQLYEPWQQHKRGNVRLPSVAELNPKRIHQQVLDLLKCRESLVEIETAHRGFALDETLASLGDKLINA